MAFNDSQTILRDIDQNQPNVNAKFDANFFSQSNTGTKRKLTITYGGGKQLKLDSTPNILQLPKPATEPRMDANLAGIGALPDEGIPITSTPVISQTTTLTRKKITFLEPGCEMVTIDATPIVQTSTVLAQPAFGAEVNVSVTQNENTPSNGTDCSQPNTTEKSTTYVMLAFKKVDLNGVQSLQTDSTNKPASKPNHTHGTESPFPINSNANLLSTSTIPDKSSTTPAQHKTYSISSNPDPENAARHKEIIDALHTLTEWVIELATHMEKDLALLMEDVKEIRSIITTTRAEENEHHSNIF
ncbi:uncharacterized protein LOC118506881 [Anopheles stephensi]|uniref:uncharacterized protein LOC118506881 n=1 Tax=Anopheles stephensi TaxID=30069 RepID=UPI0016587939|nr:uncharacterized protein LOC118506881 [Anopheles stephensi]